jgi:hypothetical protein
MNFDGDSDFSRFSPLVTRLTGNIFIWYHINSKAKRVSTAPEALERCWVTALKLYRVKVGGAIWTTR